MTEMKEIKYVVFLYKFDSYGSTGYDKICEVSIEYNTEEEAKKSIPGLIIKWKKNHSYATWMDVDPEYDWRVEKVVK